jgi:hypothetical protein
MNHRNDENLKELFERFFDAEQAEKCLEDVQKAEQILHEYPAPEPDDMLLANIKAEIAMRLPAKRPNVFTHVGYKIANVAAAVIFLAAVSMSLFEKDSNQSRPREVSLAAIIPVAVWESDDIAADDMDLAGYTVEIEQIEDELMALQSGEGGHDSESAVTEMEMELMETESEFWKG